MALSKKETDGLRDYIYKVVDQTHEALGFRAPMTQKGPYDPEGPL